MTLLQDRARAVKTFNGTRVDVILTRRSTMFYAQNGRAVELVRAFHRRVVSRCTGVNFVTPGHGEFTTVTEGVYVSTYRRALTHYLLVTYNAVGLSNGRRAFSGLQLRHVP